MPDKSMLDYMVEKDWATTGGKLITQKPTQTCMADYGQGTPRRRAMDHKTGVWRLGAKAENQRGMHSPANPHNDVMQLVAAKAESLGLTRNPMDEMFNSARDLLETLWQEMHTPVRDRDEFQRLYFFPQHQSHR